MGPEGHKLNESKNHDFWLIWNTSGKIMTSYAF